MIFIGGISSGTKEINYDFVKTVICSQCGSYGRYQIFMTYMYFSFFFIPLFKWNKRFYVKMSCCGTVYELNPETGKSLLKGEPVDLSQQDLTLVEKGTKPYYGYQGNKVCENCGYETGEDFEFCPKCGRRF